MVFFHRHHGNLDGHGSGRGTLLSVVRLCGMNVTPSMALDMCRNLHLTIPYLLKDVWGTLNLSSLVELVTREAKG